MSVIQSVRQSIQTHTVQPKFVQTHRAVFKLYVRSQSFHKVHVWQMFVAMWIKWCARQWCNSAACIKWDISLSANIRWSWNKLEDDNTEYTYMWFCQTVWNKMGCFFPTIKLYFKEKNRTSVCKEVKQSNLTGKKRETTGQMFATLTFKNILLLCGAPPNFPGWGSIKFYLICICCTSFSESREATSEITIKILKFLHHVITFWPGLPFISRHFYSSFYHTKVLLYNL